MGSDDAGVMGKGIFTALKINVAQLGSPAGLYGAERWILALVRHLDPAEIHSIVAAIKDEPNLKVPLCEQASKLGFETKIFTAYGKFNLSAVKQLRQFIRRKNIHILHTHGYKQDLIGLMAVIGTSCKIISTPHGWSQEAGFKLQCYEIINRMVFPFFDAVIPLSKNLYDDLVPIPFLKRRLNFIQNGVDTTEIQNCSVTAEALIEWKQDGFFIIGYIGQLIQRKGLDVLLQAVRILDEKIKWKLVLVGEGDQRKQLENRAIQLDIADSVHFLGFRQNRLEFLNGFDVFVLPSSLEGIPRCLMEAMTAGIPVIASRIPGCTDLIADNQTGVLFKKNDPNELAKKIRIVLQDEVFSRKLVQRGMALIHNEFSGERMAQNYASAYNRLRQN
ncbi:MAG: glycosyltransferase family 4 protein [Desulfobacula sp.]|nr:glycosyltransferase family 4 protein [Desulfobacula sp.]